MHTPCLKKRIVSTSTGLSALILLLLAGCSSGGSSTSATPLSITGTTSTGAALSGASLEARCSNGTSGSATSSSDGSYTVLIEGGALPCMLRASGKDASGNDITLHSVASASTTANVTPLTELIVAAATGTQGGTPSDAFAQFAASSDTQNSLSTEKLSFARTVVASAVSAAGTAGGKTVDLTGIDPLSDSFKVNTANDRLIDDLVVALKKNASTAKISQVIASLSEGVRNVAMANPTSAADAASNAIAQAQAVVDRPVFAIPSCPAARSVRYRIVGVHGGTGLTGEVNFSGSSGTVATVWEGHDGPEDDTFTFDSDNPCKFTMTSGASNSSVMTGAFAASGVFVVESSGQNDAGIGVGFPAQTISLAELAGTWNALEFSKDASGWKNFQYLLTLDSAGHFSSMKTCSGTSTDDNNCTTPSGAPTQLTTNANGGFDAIGGDGHGGRVFAFKSGAGTLMMVVALSPLDGGGLIIATPQADATPPAVGDVSKGYLVSASPDSSVPSGLSASFHSYTSKVTASDATTTTGAVTFDGANAVLTPVERWNQPRTGLGNRAAFPSHDASIGLQIKGTGLTVRISAGVNTLANPGPFMTLSVRR